MQHPFYFSLLVVYVALGPVTWILFGALMIMGRRRMMLLKKPVPKAKDPSPRATILIPAKDEGPRIRDCLLSALAQDYPNYHVVAVDDRSTDETGKMMDEVAAADPRLKVLHIEHGSLPEGWTGKCNALQQAVKLAEGQWLLFIDSDVVISPDALRAVLRRSEASKYDVLSLWPKLESHSFFEALLVPLAAAGVSMMYLVGLTNKDYMRNVAFANGQFLFILRKTYDEMGGHSAVKDRFCEDVEIARLLKRQGKRIRISWGTEYAAVRMYSSLKAIFKGWGRNFYAGSLGKPWRILMGMAFVIFCCFSGYGVLAGSLVALAAAASLTAWTWFVASAIHLLAMHGFLAMMYAWSGNPRRNAILFPLGGSLLLGVFFKSLRMCITNKVEWRGTNYSHRMNNDPVAAKS
ncbi:MAG: glycosyltransferase [Phycisphaerales bacterium]|jgi:cellulose synthase/poly-beta-1,6-N-acetylglucosamine synthase-like glycosyltransferase|nr:glycosyltransferase [Phycisphaerales bacterium]